MKKISLVIGMLVSIVCFGGYRDRVCIIKHHTPKGELIITDTLYNFPINKDYVYGLFVPKDSALYYTLERKNLGAINWDYSTYTYDTLNIYYNEYSKEFKILD